MSIHHGGGVGIGRSIHAGMVCVADGTDLAAEKLERVLTTDPATGVIRHADAGYERAVEVADERGVRIPMREAVSRDRPPDRARSAIRSCASGPARSTRRRAGVAGDPGADRRPDRHDARGQRRRLAANQVHEPVRVAVIEVDHNPRYPYKPPIPLTVVVNPVIEPLDDEMVEINEGCLSVPDLRGDVDAPRQRPRALPRPRRRRARRGQARASPPARSSTRSTTSTACCSSTG